MYYTVGQFYVIILCREAYVRAAMVEVTENLFKAAC